VGVALVDKKGRTFLLSVGSAGIIVSLIAAGLIFQKTEEQRVDVKNAMQSLVSTNQELMLAFNAKTAAKLLNGKDFGVRPTTLVVIYSYGDFSGATTAVRSDSKTDSPIKITRDSVVPAKKLEAKVNHPFADYEAATSAPLKIDNALITPVPSEGIGWLTAVCIFTFMAFFAMGPGVCVWLALSELMPTRIRSNGMSIALLINQAVSTTVAAIFLPTVGKHGYAGIFFTFAGCTVIYFITATFFLPETKGKTLEEIEDHFEGPKG
jgi:MFS transporter, SP family, solute carrier family 2 (myo-inositol transporter), member 13